VLTRKCYPCGCKYCNVLKTDFNNFWNKIFNDKQYLDFILKKLVKFLNKNNYKSIRFFWWEVFLEKEILVYIIWKLREFWFNWDFIVNTNLHLFEENDLLWIKNYNVKIITSLNWFEALHCKTRWVSKKDYLKLLDSIYFLIKNNVYLQINVVLFSYEKDYIEKIKYILKFKANKINLLPLMYSNLFNEYNMWEFLSKIEKLFIWIKENNLQKRFLNFDLVKENISSSFPLVTDELVLDSDGKIYISMIVLENFAYQYKDLLFFADLEDLKSLEIDIWYITIILWKLYSLLKKQAIFSNSVLLSNKFSALLNKYS